MTDPFSQFDRLLKDPLGSLLCASGAHEWKWKYIDDSKGCEQREYCTRCPDHRLEGKIRIEHRLPRVKIPTSTLCEFNLVCSHCDSRELSIEHAFSEWTHLSRDNCTQERICNVCHQREETKKEVHSLGDWKRPSPSVCYEIRECERCHKVVEKRDIPHIYSEKWEISVRDVCIKSRRCLVCHHLDEKEAEHDFRFASHTHDGKYCLKIHKCTRCDKEETSRERHDFEWAYDSNDPPLFKSERYCRGRDICFKCGYSSDPEIRHKPFWQNIPSLSCHEYLVCERCEHTQSSSRYQDICGILIGKRRELTPAELLLYGSDYRTSHEWITFRNKCTITSKCKKCETTKELGTEHTYTSWQPWKHNSQVNHHKCQRCGVVEFDNKPRALVVVKARRGTSILVESQDGSLFDVNLSTNSAHSRYAAEMALPGARIILELTRDTKTPQEYNNYSGVSEWQWVISDIE